MVIAIAAPFLTCIYNSFPDMSNILTAIKAIIKNSHNNQIKDSDINSGNRVTKVGEPLETFIKNAFADCIGQKDNRKIEKARNKVFSYIGNNYSPPDAMLKGGDAIEIKKIKTVSTQQLQLNSSYPKNKLYAENPKLCKECITCEDWYEKDMLYVVGQVNNSELHNLLFIYGDLYCDRPEVYKNIENVLKTSLEDCKDVEFTPTNELGRVNKVDHLEISDLRIRGMWLIINPFKHFDYLINHITNTKFKLVALIPTEKYNSFYNVSDFENFCKEYNVYISDTEVANPTNPAKLIKSKLIIFYY